MKCRWKSIFSLLSGMICVFVSSTAAAAQPNIVFILVDDLGRHDLGCEGSTFYETPNIDRLASRSMRFVKGYSACQVCSPSRAAIQTGKSPVRVEITDYISPPGANQPEQWKRNTQLLPAGFRRELALEETTIAEALKALNYTTFFAGKWHLGGTGFLPTDQGYDINRGGHEAGTPPGGFFSPYRNPVLEDGPDGESLPLRLGRETAEFIRSRQGKSNPYFAMLCFYSVHAPIQTTEALWKKYRDKAERMGLIQDSTRFVLDRTQEVRQVQDNPLYAGMMEAMDLAVGNVLTAVEESGQNEDTIIIFTSDNGGVSSGDGYATACLPLRGGKGRQWEGGIRAPFYIALPGKTSGQSTEAFATGMDFFPTLVELAGGQVPAGLDGISLVPVLNGQNMPSRPLFWHYPHYGNQGGEPSAIVRDGEWKLIHYFEDGRDELYNLVTDLGEQNNIIDQEPFRARSMSRQLQQWLVDVNAKMPTKNEGYDAAEHEAGLQRLRTSGLPRREKEHAAMLQRDFVPGGGWWENKKR
ncbi:MAG: sulfatase [Planctomycetales bacterium]|nr:sulfatase [Planctomycetales bacterium]